jgi:hypothetical protein
VQIQNNSDPQSTETVDTPTGEVGTSITKRQTDPGPELGCPEGSDSACGSGNVPVSPSLDTSNNEPLKVVEGIDKIATVLQFIPLTSAPASLIRIAIAAGRGDTWSAGENLAMSIPFVAPIRRLGTFVKAADEVAEGSYIVYQGINPATKAVEYVGITSRDLLIRAAEHRRVPAKAVLDFLEVEGASNLTKIQARVWEQKLINQRGLGNLQNKINSIAEKYWSIYGIK